jgi:hypothetical protein
MREMSGSMPANACVRQEMLEALASLILSAWYLAISITCGPWEQDGGHDVAKRSLAITATEKLMVS